MPTQTDKAARFRALHQRDFAFIIPNPRDVGSACVLAQLGFEALATTSAGLANSLGKPDNALERDTVLEHARSIVAATELPVSADLENGFGDPPDVVAQTIALAAETGLCGGSIEDSTQRGDEPIYPRELAVDRIRAAVDVVRGLPLPFLLTARCENYLVGRPDLADTIERLQAYQEAGADVLYAPGLATEADIATVVRSVDRPLNVLTGVRANSLNLPQLSALGVRRVSVGSGLYRAAFGGFLRAAQEMRDHGTFQFAEQATSFRDVSKFFQAASQPPVG
jgi:2-methylisocitrate lyase-like PEP mutase family enzyme